jgi:hypothetical protein
VKPELAALVKAAKAELAKLPQLEPLPRIVVIDKKQATYKDPGQSFLKIQREYHGGYVE